MINADLLMMETVLRNMISNAIKFTPVGGKITIDAKNLDDRVEIRVSDTGVGISSDKVNRLFKIEESFTTVGTNEETGTGLGLVLCNDFVKQHRGNIVVESKVNAGTTFVITIPK
jgi:Signal transduction histidine kinase